MSEARVSETPMAARLYPILWGSRDQPPKVPWSIVWPHEPQAIKNHRQSLEQLASRGGLDPTELIAVLEDRPWREMNIGDAVLSIKRLVAKAAP